MNYYFLSLIGLAFVYSNFGVCCQCREDEKDDGKVNNVVDIHNASVVDIHNASAAEEEKEYLFNVVKKRGLATTIAKCFYPGWYNDHGQQVIVLEEAAEGEQGERFMKVIGKKDNWKIVSADAFSDTLCDSRSNTWIIVKIKLKENTKPLYFYVDTVEKCVLSGVGVGYNAFSNVSCWSLEIIAANTSAATNFNRLFWFFHSDLEFSSHLEESGLRGLDRLNVSKATEMDGMFSKAILKQNTLNSLKRWRTFEADNIVIGPIFCTSDVTRYKCSTLDFRVLNDWEKNTAGRTIVWDAMSNELENVFFSDYSRPATNPLVPEWSTQIRGVQQLRSRA